MSEKMKASNSNAMWLVRCPSPRSVLGTAPTFPYEQMLLATRNLAEKLGGGGEGEVHVVSLSCFNPTPFIRVPAAETFNQLNVGFICFLHAAAAANAMLLPNSSLFYLYRVLCFFFAWQNRLH